MAMALGGRNASAELGTFQILFFRSFIGLVLISCVILHKGWKQLLTGSFGLHMLRNIAHFGGQFGWFHGLALIPLAEVFALEFTVPVWTAFVAALLLREKITPPRLAVIGLGLLGMLIILRPGLGVIQPASLVVLGSAVCFALSHTLTRKLAQTDSPLSIVFYMTLIQLPMAFLPALSQWVNPSWISWCWLVIVGVTALSAHYCMAQALKLSDATVVVPMDFLRLPLIALVGFLFYEEAFDGFVIGGAFLMLVGNLINIHWERLRLQRI